MKQHPEYVFNAALTEMVEMVEIALGGLILKYLAKNIRHEGPSVSGVDRQALCLHAPADPHDPELRNKQV